MLTCSYTLAWWKPHKEDNFSKLSDITSFGGCLLCSAVIDNLQFKGFSANIYFTCYKRIQSLENWQLMWLEIWHNINCVLKYKLSKINYDSYLKPRAKWLPRQPRYEIKENCHMKGKLKDPLFYPALPTDAGSRRKQSSFQEYLRHPSHCSLPLNAPLNYPDLHRTVPSDVQRVHWIVAHCSVGGIHLHQCSAV